MKTIINVLVNLILMYCLYQMVVLFLALPKFNLVTLIAVTITTILITTFLEVTHGKI